MGHVTHTLVRTATQVLNQDDLPAHVHTPQWHLHTTCNNWKVYILVIFNFITLKPTFRFENGDPMSKSFQLLLKYS